MATTDAVVEAYIKLRDTKKETAARHREELAPLNEKMKKIEAYLLMDLSEKGIESARTEHGTAYKTTRVSVKVEDFEAFIVFVGKHEFWHLLDRRANKSSVEEFLDSTGELPPGLSITTDLGINVRR